MNMFQGGIGDGYDQSFTDGTLNGIDLSAMFKSGIGDGYVDNRSLSTLNGISVIGMFKGGVGDGYDQSFATSFLQGLAFAVELSHFEAYLENREVVLKWGTESEVNHDYFTIERSQDGLVFESVLEVKGRGTPNRPMQYRALDENPYSGISFYRLKSTDLDGSFEYSHLEEIRIKQDGNWQMLVFPNPNSGNNIHIRLLDLESPNDIQIKIIDLHGRILVNRTFRTLQADLIHSIQTERSLASGTYLISVHTAQSFKQQLMIVR